MPHHPTDAPSSAAHYAAAAFRIAEGPGRYARFTRKYPPLVAGAAVFIALTLLAAIFADLIAPYHYTAQTIWEDTNGSSWITYVHCGPAAPLPTTPALSRTEGVPSW